MILPDEVGEIVIQFSAADGRQGVFSAWLEVNSNDPGAPNYPIPLLATVPVTDENPLIAYWPLDEDDGSGVAIDVIRGREGIASGVLFGVPGAQRYTGTSAYFNGFDGRIQLAHSMDLNPLSFTLVAWAKSVGRNDDGELWSSLITSRNDFSDDGQRSEGYVIQDPSEAGLWAFWSGNGADTADFQSLDGPKVTPGKWQHIAVRYDDTIQRKELFLDGKSVAFQNARIEPNTATPFNIGAGEDFGTDHWFEGCVDELALFRTALSDRDIHSIYVNGVQAYRNGIAIFQIVGVHYDPVTNKVALTFNSSAGRSYRLERSESLSADGSPWIELEDGIDANGPMTTVIDEFPIPGAGRYFYRISLE